MPATAEQMSQPDDSGEKSPDLRTRIAFVDDHYIVRLGIRSLCEAQDYVIVGEYDDLSTILDVDTVNRDADVLILDLNLQTTTGLQTLRKALEMFPKLPILVYSMENRVSTIVRAYKLGAQGFLVKDESDLEDLTAAIAKLKAGKVFVRPDLAEEVLTAVVKDEDTGPPEPTEALSPTELRILLMLVSGKTSEEVANELGMAEKSVATRISSIKRKLHIEPQMLWEAVGERFHLLPPKLSTDSVDNSD